jgi:hypothetical protein
MNDRRSFFKMLAGAVAGLFVLPIAGCNTKIFRQGKTSAAISVFIEQLRLFKKRLNALSDDELEALENEYWGRQADDPEVEVIRQAIMDEQERRSPYPQFTISPDEYWKQESAKFWRTFLAEDEPFRAQRRKESLEYWEKKFHRQLGLRAQVRKLQGFIS